MRRLLALLLLLCSATMAFAGGVETPTWRQDETFAKSPDQAFIRQWALEIEDFPDAQCCAPWDVEDIVVLYFDVNDDGIDEMMLHFEVASYFCGSGGCWTFFFQKKDGQWHGIGKGFFITGATPDGPEIIQGYRTLYSSNGMGMRWTGEQYEQACVGYPPEWNADPEGCTCCEAEEERRQRRQ